MLYSASSQACKGPELFNGSDYQENLRIVYLEPLAWQSEWQPALRSLATHCTGITDLWLHTELDTVLKQNISKNKPFLALTTTEEKNIMLLAPLPLKTMTFMIEHYSTSPEGEVSEKDRQTERIKRA